MKSALFVKTNTGVDNQLMLGGQSGGRNYPEPEKRVVRAIISQL